MWSRSKPIKNAKQKAKELIWGAREVHLSWENRGILFIGLFSGSLCAETIEIPG